jgi:hypothetical protein
MKRIYKSFELDPDWIKGAAQLVGVSPDQCEVEHDSDTGETSVSNVFGVHAPIGVVAIDSILKGAS